MNKLVMVGLAALATASTADAATLVPSYSAGSALPGYTTATVFEDFSQIPVAPGPTGTPYIGGPTQQAPSPYTETASNSAVYNTSQTGAAVDPTSASGNYLAVEKGGSYTVSFGSAGVQFFSFIFGSLDPYNSVTLGYLDGTSQLFVGSAITGSSTAPANGKSGGRVIYDTGGSASITSATFTSSDFSFEIDGLAAAAPEPATWALMILGFGLVGSQLRSRRRNSALSLATA